jgi:hypothetical protein
LPAAGAARRCALDPGNATVAQQPLHLDEFHRLAKTAALGEIEHHWRVGEELR